MAHPVLWPKKNHFYPIGNTTAVNLAQDLPPEQLAKILLLGCGDPRNILFTVFASGIDASTPRRTLEFTCCDMEPAILARNVLLLTLIADDENSQNQTKIWNIFYHFYLDQSSMSLLLSQCKKLVALSQNLETWNRSKYAPFLKFCSRRTLSELHRQWNLYVETQNKSPQARKTLKEKFASLARDVLKEHQNTISSGRSAGPCVPEALPTSSEDFRYFWETGSTSEDPEVVASASLVNPVFAYSLSGEGAFPHYGTNPLLSFHLVMAFADIKRNGDGHEHLNRKPSTFKVARSEFSDWCSVLNASINRGDSSLKLVVKFFLGEALAFCRAMQCRNTSGSMSSDTYTATWNGSRLDLDGGHLEEERAKSDEPSFHFNVIETSNLSDHIGIMNLLLATIPLLAQDPSATLYTEALSSLWGDETLMALKSRVCGDLSVISVLLGVAPITYVSKFSSHSNAHEILLQRLVENNPQFHERLAWRVSSAEPVPADLDTATKFENVQLAKLLFKIYHSMFIEEDLMTALTKPSPKTLILQDVVHYVRRTFALFVGHVKKRIVADWDKIMGDVIALIENDRKFLMGLNNIQDLICQLHLLGVYSVDILSKSQPIPQDNRQLGRFRGWDQIPNLICVVLIVPRSKLKVVEGMAADDIGIPMIYCEVIGPDFHSIFSSIHPCFGGATVTGSGDRPGVSLKEDPAGWSGASSLIVSFWMPSWILMLAPSATSICLSFRSTPQTATQLIPKLGIPMQLFASNVMDKKSVLLALERPKLPSEIRPRVMPPTAPAGPDGLQTLVTLDNSCEKISTLSIKVAIHEENAKAQLAAGATIATEQVSPCAMELSFTGFRQRLIFPHPVEGKGYKLRIARKSKYIEVIVPVIQPDALCDFSFNPFPVLLKSLVPSVWNIHYVRLDRLPALDTSDQRQTNPWLNAHLQIMFSDREKQKNLTEGADILADVKKSLYAIIRISAGVDEKKGCLFCLTEPSTGGVNTIIIVTDLRLDLSSHTIVADACVVLLTDKIMPHIRWFLQWVTDRGATHVKTIGKEMTAWKYLLPALTERCRKWKHKDTCEYYVHGAIPLSVKFAESPICGCGRGQDIPDFPEVPNWKRLVPFLTRAAISPLFAVSYLESVAGDLKGALDAYRALVNPKNCSVCAVCGGFGKPKILLCSRCRRVNYCSKACQKTHWPSHKSSCK